MVVGTLTHVEGSSRIRRSWDEVRAQWAAADRIAELGEERQRVAAVLAIAEAPRAAPTADGRRLGIQFAPDEREVLRLEAVELVEGSRTLGRPPTAHPEVRWTSEVIEATTVEAGQAWITTHRVIYQGPEHARAWSFYDLQGIDVAKGAPLLYFLHPGRRKTGGLRVPPNRIDEVLDHLEIALAVSRGEGDAFTRSLRHRLQALDDGLREHEGEVPGGSPVGRRLGGWARQGWQFLWKPADGPWLPAGIGGRVAAHAIDGLLLWAIPMAGIVALLVLAGFPPGLDADADMASRDFASTDLARLLSVAGLAATGVFIVVEALFYARSGATPGKRRLGLMVVDVRTGEPPSFTRALMRGGAAIALALRWTALAIDVLFVLLHPQRHALHDRVARTAVVRRI